jgi:acyl-CoA hydrolase
VYTTSLEVGVRVSAENTLTGDRVHTNTAYLTFVAIDERGKPVPVPAAVPETDDERRRFDQALSRRELRLQHRRSL